MTIFAALVEIGLSRLLDRLRVVFQPVIAGFAVLVVGLQLGVVGTSETLDVTGETSPDFPWHVAVAFVTLGACIAFSIWGRGILRLVATLLGLALGVVLALRHRRHRPGDLRRDRRRRLDRPARSVLHRLRLRAGADPRLHRRGHRGDAPHRRRRHHGAAHQRRRLEAPGHGQHRPRHRRRRPRLPRRRHRQRPGHEQRRLARRPVERDPGDQPRHRLRRPPPSSSSSPSSRRSARRSSPSRSRSPARSSSSPPHSSSSAASR